ncbi:hypothetical protein BS50DRAFT_622109 [Corynespora cassiicola Philippines]|uniref:Mid2 domain-containing protein n=1 Tax=Corynespora cassiicola Philippines TaxID=1448308 RepID=A0A2T2NLZ6_CORCC|nr:hypothetical protein BS50DRAFT_622109 [Corynespora cassiicola Philippines]
MPAANPTLPLRPRWPAPPYSNETFATSSASPRPGNNVPNAVEQTPVSIPEPVYETVSILPADQIPAEPTRNPVAQYQGRSETLLKGYCTEPAYTILDGPTAVWIPVVGCISSKPDCCPTQTTDGGSNPESTGDGSGNPGENNQKPDGDGGDTGGGIGGQGQGAQFPISFMPTQGVLTGCPKDYHTVGGTACCPSSYWLWSTTLGGQVPCYSSLSKPLVPPPIPETLVDDRGGPDITGSYTGSSSAPPTALTMTSKPTLAIVNIAYAMQFPVVPPPKPALETDAKIGIGVGVSCGALLMGVIVWLLLKKYRAREKAAVAQQIPSASQRFNSQVDMSRIAHEPAGLERSFGGAKYMGVSTRGIDH